MERGGAIIIAPSLLLVIFRLEIDVYKRQAEKEVPIELKAAIMLAQKNIHTFHSSQRFEGKKVQTLYLIHI